MVGDDRPRLVGIRDRVAVAREVGAQTVVPIHVAVLTDAGKALADRVAGPLVEPSSYRRLAVGEELTVQRTA